MKYNLKQLSNLIINTPVNRIPEKISHKIHQAISPFPDLIILQTVSLCNLKCSHCFINNYGNEILDGKKLILKYSDFINLIDNMKPAIKKASYFQFSTFEPFIHKDLFRMMDHILTINPNIEFPIITNTKALNDDILKQLKNYKLSEFTISLDGINKETVENFKTGASFDHIISTIKKVVAADYKIPISTVFVLHKDNYLELPEYIDFVGDLGVKNVFVNNLLAFTPEKRDLYLYKKNGNPEVEKIFEEAIQRIEQRNMKIWLPSMKPELRGCSTVNILIVDWNGNVVPCDFLAVSTPFELFGEEKKGKPVIFGNVHDDEALEIFRSDAFKKFRNSHNSGKNIPESCSHCIDAYSLMCSHRKIFGNG